MKSFALSIIALNVTFISGCDRATITDLQAIDIYGDHAVYFDPSTIRRQGETVVVMTVWGPQNPDERYEKGEMRRTVQMNCHTTYYLDRGEGLYVHNRKVGEPKNLQPIIGYANHPGYAKTLFDRLC